MQAQAEARPQTSQLSKASLLGPRALEVIERIPDLRLRHAVDQAIGLCHQTLSQLDHLEFTQHELSSRQRVDLTVWERVAPDLRDTMTAVRHTVRDLRNLFPTASNDDADPQLPSASPDVDDAFGEWEEPKKQESATVDTQSDDPVAQAKSLGTTIEVLSAMLEQEFIKFGHRIRQPQVVGNRWTLLSELEEFRTKCAKFLEAVLANFITTFSPEDLSEILPRYRSAGEQASLLRTAVIDLGREVSVYNRAMDAANDEEIIVLSRSLRQLMEEFAQSTIYRLVRAQDKQHLVQVRADLKVLDQQSLAAIRERVEDFARFLDLMRGINRRAELMDADRVHLESAQEMLMSDVPPTALMGLLNKVYGRDELLDQWLRRHQYELPTTVNNNLREQLSKLIQGALVQLNPFGGF